jgi:hypothetical protein
MPYGTRGLYGRDGPGPERFDKRTWIQRDVCAREPFPFDDDSIDFVVCSQTLEDVRDPLWVCEEMVRIAKAGYVEVPSRLEEQTWGVHGPWVGWSHHRWLIDVTPGRLEFVFKPHLLHARQDSRFPAGFLATLSAEERVSTLWWEGRFEATERTFRSPQELDSYLADFVRARAGRAAPAGGRTGLRRLVPRLRRP